MRGSTPTARKVCDMAIRSARNARARSGLDRRLADLRGLGGSSTTRPSGGWIRAIRESLGMSTPDLAGRLGVAVSTVSRMEHSERVGRIQLDTLERVADHLGCDLVYVLLPRQPLEQMIEERAREVARRELLSLGHTMNLEAQGLTNQGMRERLESLTEELKAQPGLWRVSQDS